MAAWKTKSLRRQYYYLIIKAYKPELFTKLSAENVIDVMSYQLDLNSTDTYYIGGNGEN